MRKIAFLGVLVLVALPAAALAENSPSPSQQAAALCKQQRVAIGMKAFKLLHGSSNAYGKCVSKAVKSVNSAQSNAAKQCAAERADVNFPQAAGHDGKTFQQFYGTGKNGRNAFGKCVSTKAQMQVEQQQKSTINAAKTCAAERAKSAAAFEATYGGRANAFGKCVSQHAKAKP